MIIIAICPKCKIEFTDNFCPRCGESAVRSPIKPYLRSYRQTILKPLPPKVKSALVLAVISLIMLLIAGSISWWSISYEYEVVGANPESKEEVMWDFIFEEFTCESNGFKSDGDLNGDLGDVGNTTGLLFRLGIIMNIIVVVLICLLIALSFSRNTRLNMYTKIFKNLALLFVLLAVIFILVALVYYMVAWPKTWEEHIAGPYGLEVMGYDGSFIGSNSFEFALSWEDICIGEIRWGPGPGYILAFICLILSIIILVFVKFAGDEAMRLSTAPQPKPLSRNLLPPPQKYQ